MSGLTVVAMSGGVDSSTCAGLLAERGERVVGLAMRLYNAAGTQASSGGRCCGPRDLEDARAVCAYLGIPFYVVNYEAAFKAAVMDDFVENYARGRTPNPCVRCNEKIKFLPLLHRARALGASRLCTGHYARIVEGGLYRAQDAKKDQSYFLFSMPRDSLPYVEFPLGGMTKDEVRGEARRLGLPNAEKPDSQEICFVPDGDYAGFVKSQVAVEGGEIVEESTGKVVGHHEGVHRFTVGQRKGLGSSGEEGRYVVGIDALLRKVRVGPREALLRSSVVVEEARWLIEDPPAGSRVEAAVQIRYRHPPQPAEITLLSPRQVQVDFAVPEYAPAPGQAAVFYRGDRVLGGGFIS